MWRGCPDEVCWKPGHGVPGKESRNPACWPLRICHSFSPWLLLRASFPIILLPLHNQIYPLLWLSCHRLAFSSGRQNICLPDPRCGTHADPALGAMSIPRECSGIQPSLRTDRRSNSSQLALSKHQNNENSPQIMSRNHSGRENIKITRNYLRSMASVGDLQPCSLLITFNFF